MLKFILFLSISYITFSLSTQIEISKQELEQLLKEVLVKYSNTNIKLPFNYQLNAGVGKLIAQQIEFENIVFNEDSLSIIFQMNKNQISLQGYIDSFDLNLDVEIQTLLGTLLKQILNFKVTGLDFKINFQIKDNLLDTENLKFETLDIKQFKLKSGDGKIQSIINAIINQLIETFKNFMQQKIITNIEKKVNQNEIFDKIEYIAITNNQNLILKIVTDVKKLMIFQNRN